MPPMAAKNEIVRGLDAREEPFQIGPQLFWLEHA